MRKFIEFLRSMKFGIILLVVILALSFVASFIPQGNSEEWYKNAYPSAYHFVLAFGLDRLFSTWYFITLGVVFCVDLAVCSFPRFPRILKKIRTQAERAADTRIDVPLEAERLAVLESHLKKARYRKREMNSADGTPVRVWTKNALGYFGAFSTHIALLLLCVVGGALLYTTEMDDHLILPEQTLVLGDGTRVVVDSFQIEDETGRLDYKSVLTITAPDGEVSEGVELKVNYPHRFKNRKYYQHTYGTCGSITVRDREGNEDKYFLNELTFLSADGINGIWYQNVYPDFIQDPSGNYTFITSTMGAYKNPVYELSVATMRGRTPTLAFPGDDIEMGNLTFTFNEPEAYPGIRVKTLPAFVLVLLYITFVVLIAALWLCFFHVPIAFVVSDGGFAMAKGKNTGAAIEVASVLGLDFVPVYKKKK